MSDHAAHVVGAGLAGSEAAWQLAERGHRVLLSEMRPVVPTPAHRTDRFAELVCSNSLGSDVPDRAGGLLHAEMRRMGSFILSCAETARVPAGGALAVDRERFAEEVTRRLTSHPLIEVRREEVTAIPSGPAVIASGPLTSAALAASLRELTGTEALYFYDAISPIVERDSLDMAVCFQSSRYGRGELEEGDYLNCPLNREEYQRFVAALQAAEKIPLRDFEKEDSLFFEGCLPIEILAARGEEALAFGPMRARRADRPPERPPSPCRGPAPPGQSGRVALQSGRLPDEPEMGRAGTGAPAHPRPGTAEFVRLGQMHRNTFINAPLLLEPSLHFKKRPDLFFAGQIVGVEGYAGNAATGLLAGINLARLIEGRPSLVLPRETMTGALCWYITHAEAKHFQPMKANFGVLPELAPEGRPKDKRERGGAYARRALEILESTLAETALAL